MSTSASTPPGSPQKFKWDTLYSTYYWMIHLDKSHRANSPNVPYLSGYSKVVHQNEAQDKEQLLRRKIITLLNYGYFPRMERIEIWERSNFAVNKKIDPKILVLYPKHYDIPEMEMDRIFKLHGVWLKEFYDCYLANRTMEHLIPTNKKFTSNDEWLNIHKFNFAGPAQMYSHAARLSTHGHPPGAITDFIRRYKELKQWN